MNIYSMKFKPITAQARMSPRRYRLDRRAETTEETRRRIVQATQELHAQQGIYATSMTHIAERAGVSVGTVYHHFPTYQNAVSACAQHTAEMLPLPTAQVFTGLSTLEDRVQRLARDIFGFYERLPEYERVRSERWGMPPIEAFVEREENNRLALTRDALRPFTVSARLVTACAALLDVAVYAALTHAGMSSAKAAEEVSAFILARLEAARRSSRA
jgi:AcrR family transcriptional regulator